MKRKYFAPIFGIILLAQNYSAGQDVAFENFKAAQEAMDIEEKATSDKSEKFDLKCVVCGKQQIWTFGGTHQGIFGLRSPFHVPLTEEQFERLKVKAKSFASKTLVFKGFYLGMPFEDATFLVRYYLSTYKQMFMARHLNDKFILYPVTWKRDPPKDFPAHKFHEHKTFHLNGEEEIIRANKDGKVTQFHFNGTMLMNLFGLEKSMLHRTFLESFLGAYSIEKLEPRHSVYNHCLPLFKFNGNPNKVSYDTYFMRSEQGYEINFFMGNSRTDTVNDQIKCMDLKSIQTREHIKSQFD